MLVLVSSQQAAEKFRRDSDYHWTDDGELVWPYQVADDDRGLSGLNSLRGTLVGVVERRDSEEVETAVERSRLVQSSDRGLVTLDDVMNALDSLSDELELLGFGDGEAVRIVTERRMVYTFVPADDRELAQPVPGPRTRPSSFAASIDADG